MYYSQIRVPSQSGADLYVRGFFTGGGYEKIPLEENAYALDERYARNPAGSFSVTPEIPTWITGKRL